MYKKLLFLALIIASFFCLTHSQAEETQAASEANRQESIPELLDKVKSLQKQIDDLSKKIGDGSLTSTIPSETESMGNGATFPRFPMIEHRYSIGTTPLGGGGYFWFGNGDSPFTFAIQNQFVLDGTFYNQNMLTNETGFNIPFYRLFGFGNLTENISYQAGVQSSLGSFNILDLFMTAKLSDGINLRVGRFLSPFLLEYFAWSPAMEPVLTNSPVAQIAGKRQVGAMLFGDVFNNRLQYQAGMFNGEEGAFFSIDNNYSFLGTVTLTPFKNTGFESLSNFGCGFGTSVGNQFYFLNQGDTDNFINGAGEPTLNYNFVTSTGASFFQYAPNVFANGMQTKVAPHLFYYGQFSVTAEWALMSRELANGINQATSVASGFYVNASYFLTGEKHFGGNGLQGYSTVEPISPFQPTEGRYGIGAWEIACQYSNFGISQNNLQLFSLPGTTPASSVNQVMVGLNWWPNKFTRVSFDWVYDSFNNPTDLATGTGLLKDFDIYWLRWSAFF